MTTAIDRIAAETNITSAPAGRKRRVSRKLSQAIELLVRGEVTQQKIAARRVGLSEAHLSHALREPHVRVFVSERVRQNLSNGTMRAGAKLLELIDSESQRVAFEAARCVLGIDGIRAAETPNLAVNLHASIGYVIDLRSDAEIRRGVTIDGTSSAPDGSRADR